MTAPVEVVCGGSLPATFPRGDFAGSANFTVAQTREELVACLRNAEVLYSSTVPEIVPGQTPELHWIHLPSAGADYLQDKPVWESDVILTSSKGIHTVPMAEHLFAMLLALTRELPRVIRAQSRHDWLHNSPATPLNPREIRGKTMAIIGWGKIGDGVAHLARSFGMRVIGTRWTLHVPREQPSSIASFSAAPWLEPVESRPDIVYPAAQLHEVLSHADVTVLIVPLTVATKGSFGRAEFAAMKRGSFFFNLGRGPVVREADLIEALRSGHLAGAGLDVFGHEPLSKDSPMWDMPNVVVSPHLGGFGDHTRERGAHFFAVNLRRYLDREPLLNIVEKARGY
jgi:phosphoglycerate dehydrogenase-like enzyme